MRRNQVVRLSAGVVVAIGLALLLPSGVQGQAARQAKAADIAVFSDAMAKAKEASRPLVVFGVNEGCSRCAAMKQALATQPDLQLLMTQYVSTEVRFGSREFVAIWDEALRQNPQSGPAIGTPAVFIFTTKGDSVYAGRKDGVPPDDEFKRQLIVGIEKNGGLRGPRKSLPDATLVADVSQARKLLSEGQVLSAAAAITKHVAAENVADEVAAVAQLTGLRLARTKAEEQLDSVVRQISDKGMSLVQTVAGGSGDVTKSAVQLAELDRVLGSYPSFAGRFDAAWKELLARADFPNLKEQAELIDDARQAETGPAPAEAIALYELVVSTYPGTKAAELAQLRISQLRTPKPASRLWKSKAGQFSVTASLVSFDGKSAQLRTDEGKTITVALDALSAEDQEFLKAAKPPN